MPRYTDLQRRRGLATRRRNVARRRWEARQQAIKERKEVEARLDFRSDGQMVELGQNNKVTKRVAKKLIEKATTQVPKPTLPPEIRKIEDSSFSILILSCVVGIILEFIGIGTSVWWITLLGALFFVLPLVVLGTAVEPSLEKFYKRFNEKPEWYVDVGNHVLELAEERKKRIEEMRWFYASAEWSLIRKQVIYEEGNICSECKERIASLEDVTVDHIKPRSKYPDLALDRKNLRVLCRSCNSKKGDSDSEIFAAEIE